MANMKIIPLIAEAEHQAELKAEAHIKTLIEAIDEEINELQAKIDIKLEQISARLEKLENPNDKPH